ncbi:dCTP pyrophosphatase 1 [Equus asinus]|uniref:dCTP pyrophosphatase 1 n=1 Tax=Equus przewalskii TaxID=9798 RepID=A0ABM2ESV0_EQUPR|nr:PREDICTED: dCTP pyrophosphatase 1 [Equus przewalskii]XP_014697891.1 dCTP pyrophosphatase 1 [Equus asinus]
MKQPRTSVIGQGLWRRAPCLRPVLQFSRCCCPESGLSMACGETRGDTGAEGTAAAGPFSFSPEPTLEDIRRLHAEFAAERDWDQFHQPRNLLLALVGEVGELAELFQWKPDEAGPQAWPPKERAALQEELSDVLIYLVALAARCRVDLPQAVLSKMDTNRQRYPAHLSRGSARKYTDLPHGATSEDQAMGPADLACESMGQAST